MRSPLPLKPQSKMLLCVDDNEDVLECEKAFLESFGYTVLTAPSGGKGLELASIHSIDVVIVDYFMPAMNGQQVAIEMRRLRPQAPIIMLSGALDVPEQTLKWVDDFHSQRSFGQPVVASYCAIAGMLIDREAVLYLAIVASKGAEKPGGRRKVSEKAIGPGDKGSTENQQVPCSTIHCSNRIAERVEDAFSPALFDGD